MRELRCFLDNHSDDSPDNEWITSNGDLVTFDVASAAITGNYLINMEDVVVADELGNEIDVDVLPGQVSVE